MFIWLIVDKRVELFSIIFCLMGNLEYNRNDFKFYIDCIELYFFFYKNYEFILFVCLLVKIDGVLYDVVMSMVINFDN